MVGASPWGSYTGGILGRRKVYQGHWPLTQSQETESEFSLEIYFHNTIGRYETPSLHSAIEMLSWKPG